MNDSTLMMLKTTWKILRESQNCSRQICPSNSGGLYTIDRKLMNIDLSPLPQYRASRVLRKFIKRIALIDIACFESFFEPIHSLFRCSVCEGIGYYIALRLFLQSVVADGTGSAQGF